MHCLWAQVQATSPSGLSALLLYFSFLILCGNPCINKLWCVSRPRWAWRSRTARSYRQHILYGMNSLRKALAAKAKVSPTDVQRHERSIQSTYSEHATEDDKWANLPPEILGSVFGRLKDLAAGSHCGLFTSIKTSEVWCGPSYLQMRRVVHSYRHEASNGNVPSMDERGIVY